MTPSIKDSRISMISLFYNIQDYEIEKWHKSSEDGETAYFLRYQDNRAFLILPDSSDNNQTRVYLGAVNWETLSIKGPWVFENSKFSKETSEFMRNHLAFLIRNHKQLFNSLEEKVKESIKEAFNTI